MRSARAMTESSTPQLDPPTWVCQVSHPRWEALGADTADPARALIDQALAQTHLGAQVGDELGGDPGLGQRTGQQQVAEMTGVGAVGLGPPLLSPQCPGVRGLRAMCSEPAPLQLLTAERP